MTNKNNVKTDNAKKLNLHSLLSVLTIALGFALLIFMIVVEGEPGAIPLLVIIAGTGWYFFSRFKIRSQR